MVTEFQLIALVVVSLLHSSQGSGSEPTVIFLGANGRPVAQPTSANDGSGLSNNFASFGSAASIISTLKSRESTRSESSGGSLYSLIRDRLGEKLQERSSKKSGPRIIVIPQMGKSSQPQQQQQQQQPSPSSGYQSTGSSYAAAYPSSYASYSSPYASAAASSSYPSYASYAYPAQMSGYQNSYGYGPYSMSPAYASPYGSSYQYGGGSGSGSGMQPSAAASAPYASYAYAPTNFLSNLMSSGSSAASSLLSKSTYSSLYPYLAQVLSQTFYPY